MSAHGQYSEHLAAQLSLKVWQTKPRFHAFESAVTVLRDSVAGLRNL